MRKQDKNESSSKRWNISEGAVSKLLMPFSKVWKEGENPYKLEDSSHHPNQKARKRP